jgi:hypothetical protein
MSTTFIKVTGASNNAPVYINPAHVAMVMANPQPNAEGSLIIFNMSVGTMEERAVRPEILQVKDELSVLRLRLEGFGR